jgi:hypothetical protein
MDLFKCMSSIVTWFEIKFSWCVLYYSLLLIWLQHVYMCFILSHSHILFSLSPLKNVQVKDIQSVLQPLIAEDSTLVDPNTKLKLTAFQDLDDHKARKVNFSLSSAHHTITFLCHSFKREGWLTFCFCFTCLGDWLKALQKRADSKSPEERLDAIECLSIATIMSRSTVHAVRTLKFVQQKIKNEGTLTLSYTIFIYYSHSHAYLLS